MTDYRLLIIDDDITIHKLYTDVAEAIGYNVKAVDGILPLQMIWQEFNPTLIFLDLSLIEGDGVEILRFLSDVECKTPIIIMSSHDAKVRATTVRLGESKGLKMEGSHQKPVAISTLNTILTQHKKSVAFNMDSVLEAIENKEFILHFQPIVDIVSNNVVGAEALVRWKKSNNELIYPDQFIPHIEKTSLIRGLSRYIIDMAMQQISYYNIDLELSINLSALDLVDLSLPDEIAQYAKKYKIDPSKICFELTETAVMTQPKKAMDILTRLRIHGFGLSMDDFGTGYSSLVELNRMPFSKLKIDKSFIMNLNENSSELPIVRSVIDLARNLNLHVIAEGVETSEAWELLEKAGCRFAQGYLISRPIEIEILQKFSKTYPKKNR